MIILSQCSKRWRTFLVVDIFCKLQKLMEKNGILVTLDSTLEEDCDAENGKLNKTNMKPRITIVLANLSSFSIERCTRFRELIKALTERKFNQIIKMIGIIYLAKAKSIVDMIFI